MHKKEFEIVAQILIMHQTHASNTSMNTLINEACAVLKGTNLEFDADKFTTYVLKHK